MPRSSGTYSPPAGQPVVSGTVISSATFNSLVSDLGNEITNSIPRDGSAPPTANVPMGNFKITGLGAATLATDVPQFQQFQSGASSFLTAVAGTNAITATLTSPALTAYATGNTFGFVAAGSNTTATTININALGIKTLNKDGVALVSGDIVLGKTYIVIYDGTNFNLFSGAGFSATNLQAQTYTAFTTAGTTIAYTLTPSPALASLTTGHRFNVTFNATAGVAPTLAISGLVAKLLKVYDSSGAKQPAGATTIIANLNSDIIYDGTDYVVLAPIIPTPIVTSKIQPITATVATNALTLGINATTLDFRATTLGSGTVTTVSTAVAISMIVPSGTLLGHTNAVLGRDIVLAINNAGTMEVAVNFSGSGVNLDETGVITTEAITVGCTFTGTITVTTGVLTLTSTGTGALTLKQSISGANVNSGTYVIALLTGVLGANGSTYSTNQTTAAASTTITGSAGYGVYSTTARTGVAYRVVGYEESTQATAGTWATAPSLIQGAGGQSVVPIAVKSTLNAAGDAPIYACRAWVNFNGTGTVAIRASGNVSSITDNGVGDYTVNFTTAMQDANYCVAICSVAKSATEVLRNVNVAGSASAGASLKSTTQLQVISGSTTTAGLSDQAEINIAIFR